MRCQLIVAASAGRQIAKLPAKVAAAVVAFATGPLLNNPQRVGEPLLEPLDGLWIARRGDYRIVYEIDDDRATVTVARVGHRATVHRSSRKALAEADRAAYLAHPEQPDSFWDEAQQWGEE